jgi:peptidoglycan/LPS O-acetylase OafA/YrhL
MVGLVALICSLSAGANGPYSTVILVFNGVVLLISLLPNKPLTILRPLAWLGIGAYSIYHVPALIVCGMRPWLALPTTFVVAWVSWRYIESPLIGYARRRWRYGQPIQAIPALV